MPKRPDREQLRQVERKIERAKNELVVLHYDIPRAEVALQKATAAKRKRENALQRIRNRQDVLRLRCEQYESKLESLKEILGDDDASG